MTSQVAVQPELVWIEKGQPVAVGGAEGNEQTASRWDGRRPSLASLSVKRGCEELLGL